MCRLIPEAEKPEVSDTTMTPREPNARTKQMKPKKLIWYILATLAFVAAILGIIAILDYVAGIVILNFRKTS